jgi:SAM-dependent methyltransferase
VNIVAAGSLPAAGATTGKLPVATSQERQGGVLVKAWLPPSVKNLLRPLRNVLVSKHGSELAYWKDYLDRTGYADRNDYFQRYLLAIAGEPDGGFVAGKVVADFGCGPLGSLGWATSAAVRIGIDVLADQYLDQFQDFMLKHDMIYLKSTEKVIPLPSGLVDVMFTLNALDHVQDLEAMCRELRRVLKPGGLLIGSFNLEEPATPCEPQTLNEELLQQHLLRHFKSESYRTARKGLGDDPYGPMMRSEGNYARGEEGYLWFRGSKIEG